MHGGGGGGGASGYWRLLMSRPSCRMQDGRTPLDLARERGHADVVRMLEAAQASEEPAAAGPAGGGACT